MTPALPPLKPGMIGVNLKGKLDALGTLDTMLQGDTEASHVWWVLPNGKIATTGAKALIIYGEADPEKYLRGKTFYLLETVDKIPDNKLALMQAAHDALMASGPGRIYGLWKFPLLECLAAIHGDVHRMGSKPATHKPVCPICSQAVAWCFWSAGIPIGKMFGKQDWSAVLPETILNEAKAVEAMVQAGQIDRTQSKPCYLLRMVSETPFVG